MSPLIEVLLRGAFLFAFFCLAGTTFSSFALALVLILYLVCQDNYIERQNQEIIHLKRLLGR